MKALALRVLFVIGVSFLSQCMCWAQGDKLPEKSTPAAPTEKDTGLGLTVADTRRGLESILSTEGDVKVVNGRQVRRFLSPDGRLMLQLFGEPENISQANIYHQLYQGTSEPQIEAMGLVIAVFLRNVAAELSDETRTSWFTDSSLYIMKAARPFHLKDAPALVSDRVCRLLCGTKKWLEMALVPPALMITVTTK